MGTYFVAVAWIFSIVKINSRLSYGNLSSQVKLHIKIWQDDLCSNMNITTIFKKGPFYSKTKYLWYDCQLSAFTLIIPAPWDSKFVYSEKATKFCEISTLLLSVKFIYSEKAKKFYEIITLLLTGTTLEDKS